MGQIILQDKVKIPCSFGVMKVFVFKSESLMGMSAVSRITHCASYLKKYWADLNQIFTQAGGHNGPDHTKR